MSLEGDSFGKWRRRLWPVHHHELVKLVPLLLLKFCASFNFTVLHATKDTLTVTAKGSGAEAIPILKGWVVLFMACMAMLAYSKLSNLFSRRNLFYIIMSPFILFFALYGFFLYPNQQWLCPHRFCDTLVGIIGNEHQHWIAVIRYWMNSLFFVMSELWGGVVIGLLFWGFANQVSTMQEASRFYTLFSLGGHVGVILAGPVIWQLSRGVNSAEYIYTIQYLMLVVLLVCAAMVAIYWWLNNWMEKNESMQQHAIVNEEMKQKNKLSLQQSLRYILTSPYLGFIALMVIGYGLSVTMVEVTWKAMLKLLYPSSGDYQAFMGIVHMTIGFLSFFLALFVGGNAIRKLGWLISAQVTPLVLGFFSLAFFGLYFFFTFNINDPSKMGIDALLLIVLCGAFHNVACKSMKYCLFDPTKEMAYIPLDAEGKVKGKAAVDVVASRFGKSGASWVQTALIDFVGMGSILSVSGFFFPFVVAAVAVWLFAVRSLGKRFTGLSPAAA